MSDYRILKQTETERKIVNLKTGVIRIIPMASDKQFEYLQNLRKEVGKELLKHRPTSFSASKAISKLLEKTKQKKLL